MEDDNTIEETELVDISEVSELPEKEQQEEEKQAETAPYLERRATIAMIRERFSAFFIDSLLFVYFYFLLGVVCRRAFYGSFDGPIPVYGWQGLAFHSIFVFCFFMYYLIMEGVFFTTFGKFCSWMYVRRKDGALPSMSSVFVRNVFRFIDYALPFLPFFLMELTRRHQRLGDLMAGTTVIKKQPLEKRHYPVSMANMASASVRVISSLIDLIIVSALTFGYTLLWSPEMPIVSKFLLLATPLVPFLYFVTLEAVTGTTPGKWIFGYIVCMEEGASVSFASALTRTLLRLFDTSPIGLLVLWISSKKQRTGDLAADTVVTKQTREWPGLIFSAIWVVIASIVMWAGWNNNANYLHKDFKWNFLPTMEFMGDIGEDSVYKELTITHVRFAAEAPEKLRLPAVFQPGETIYIISDVYGYQKSGRMVWIQEDLDVKYPDNSTALHQENMVDYHQVLSTRGPVELTNSIKLPANAQSGTYIVTITVRDMFAREKVEIKQAFEVKNPDQPEAEQPTYQEAPPAQQQPEQQPAAQPRAVPVPTIEEPAEGGEE